MNQEMPLPGIDPLTKPFWEGTKRHKLMMQKCPSCGRFHWLPASSCQSCGNPALTWEEVKKTGTIFTFTEVNKVVRNVAFQKQTPYLIAMAQLDDRFGIALIGDGPQRPALERRIAELSLGRRARILPPQSSEMLARSYRAMDLLVLPSISTDTWKEQYGRVLVEARACGTQVAGSNSGAIPLVVGDPEMIFPEGDVSAIVQTICRAADRQSARTVVAEVPSPVEFLRAWLSLADSCLGKKVGIKSTE